MPYNSNKGIGFKEMSDESLISRLAMPTMQACAMVILLSPVCGWGQVNHAEAQFVGWFQQKFEARPAPPKITAEDDSALSSKGYIKIGMVRAWMPDSVSKNDAAPLLQEAALAKAAQAGGDLVHLDKQTLGIKIKVPTGKTKLQRSCLRETVTTAVCPMTDPACRNFGAGSLGTKQVSSCSSWGEAEVIEITKEVKCLASDVAVWRLEPGLAQWEDQQRTKWVMPNFAEKLKSESRECQHSNVCTLSTGLTPLRLAANPGTNQVYVGNLVGKTLTVIDGATYAATVVPLGGMPGNLLVDTITNKVYVNTEDRITVLDGRTHATTKVQLGTEFRTGLAVNSATDKIYSLGQEGYVTEIDGATGRTTSIAVGKGSMDVVTNPATDRIYVTNSGDDTVTVIDGATKSTTTVAAGKRPRRAAVNVEANKIYVANWGGKSVTVIDGETNTTQMVTLQDVPTNLAVNSVTNKVYVVHGEGKGNTVSVIDGATNAVATVAVGAQPVALAVDEAYNKIYVANLMSGNVTVIDGANNATSTIPVGVFPVDIVINSANNKVYVANEKSNDVTVIDRVSGAPAKP
ncbi:MAG: YncE family protein [Bryobacteraceae bacterium]